MTAQWQLDTLIDGLFNTMLHVADLESINWTIYETLACAHCIHLANMMCQM